MLACSVDVYRQRYTKYLGDVDSKEFVKVVKARGYGKTMAEK
jgi:hypothetical protein